MKKKISIIIPAYNLEKYIGRCLDSLINQTYSNLEMIVVDDGSTDNTFTIISQYASRDNRVIVIHKCNEGVSKARLTGMLRAKGDYIGFVDGDDIIEADMYEFLLKNAEEHHADISHCGYVMDFPDGHSELFHGTKKTLLQDKQTGLIDLLEGRIIEPGLCNKLYKRDIIDSFLSNDCMDYSIKNLEDLLFNYYLFQKSNLSVYVDECKYHYILRKSSASTSISRNRIVDPVKVFRIILKETESSKVLNNIAYRRYISFLIQHATSNPYKDLKKKIKRILREEYKSYKKYNIGKKLEYMTIGVVYLYPLYRFVRYIYDLVTGMNKKYKI